MLRISLIAALSITWPAPALADILILRVEGTPGLLAGEEIKSSRTVRVPPGGYVRAVREDNVVFNIYGPFSGKIEKGGPRRSALSLIRSGLGSLLGSAVLRSGNPRPTGYEFIDLSHGGIKCVFRQSGQPLIWHPAPASATSLMLGVSTDLGHFFTWPARQSEIAWPAQIQLVDGQSYLAQIGSGNPIFFQLRVAPTGLDTLDKRLAWLAEVRCSEQLDLLLRSLPAVTKRGG